MCDAGAIRVQSPRTDPDKDSRKTLAVFTQLKQLRKESLKKPVEIYLSFIHINIHPSRVPTAPRWLDSSVGRALNGHRRGHGFKSRSNLNFFQAFFSQLLKLCKYCEGLSSIFVRIGSWTLLKLLTCEGLSCSHHPTDQILKPFCSQNFFFFLL